jgi:hypothetical protein
MFVGKALFGTAPDEIGGVLLLHSAYDSRSLEGEAFGGVWLGFWLWLLPPTSQKLNERAQKP